MPILAITIPIVALLWFYLASPQFKVVTIIAAVCTGALAAQLRQSQDLNDASTFLTAIMATVGITFISIIAGIMRKMASSPESYIARRNSFFKFIGKWGAIYATYSICITIVVFLIGAEFDVNQLTYQNWKTSSLLVQFLPLKPIVFIGLLIFYKLFVKPNIKRNPSPSIANVKRGALTQE